MSARFTIQKSNDRPQDYLCEEVGEAVKALEALASETGGTISNNGFNLVFAGGRAWVTRLKSKAQIQAEIREEQAKIYGLVMEGLRLLVEVGYQPCMLDHEVDIAVLRQTGAGRSAAGFPGHIMGLRHLAADLAMRLDGRELDAAWTWCGSSEWTLGDAENFLSRAAEWSSRQRPA